MAMPVLGGHSQKLRYEMHSTINAECVTYLAAVADSFFWVIFYIRPTH